MSGTAASPRATGYAWAPIDLAALMRVRNLHLRAKTVMEGFFRGLHQSPSHGFSAEFSEHRPYAFGDDQRYVDWRLYARTDRHYVKRFEDETNLRCYLVVDRSRSMGYGSLGYAKADYAVTLAATLGLFLTRQHDAVGALAFAEQVGGFVPARSRVGQLRSILAVLETPLAGTATDLESALELLGRLTPRRAMAIVVSDLLAPVDQLATRLRYLVAKGHDLMVFQTLDPAERDFPFESATTFQDLETGRDIYVDPRTARDEYLRRFRAHIGQIDSVCKDLGVEFFSLATNDPLEWALLGFLQARAARGRRIQRRAVGRSGR